jgi:hypothetical protein
VETTDCAELVRMANSSARDGSDLGHIVQDLRLLLVTDRTSLKFLDCVILLVMS